MNYCIILICFVFCSGCQDNTPISGVYSVVGFASWYDSRFVASGESYQEHGFTCAMRNRDFGKDYLVCNRENNKCVVVRHNDFGPALELFKSGRIIDLSRYAFSKLADLKKGIIRVRIGGVYPGETGQ